MRVIDLALKDLLQVVRDWKAGLFLVAMPILFTAFFGFIFSGGGEGDPRLPVGLVDRDAGSALSTSVHSMLEASDVIRLVVLEGKQAEQAGEMVGDEKLAAAVIILEGFSEQVVAGEVPRLTVIADQNTSAGQTAIGAVQAVVLRLLGMVETARLSAEAYEARVGFESEAAWRDYVNEALALASQAWQRPPLTVAVERAVGEDREEMSANVYTQSSPGMLVQFVIFGLNTSAMVLVLERKSKTLQRLLTTPITRTQVIAGHVLAMFLVVFVQEALLVGFGQLVFGVDYMREPLAVLLVMAALALWVASLGLLIGASAKGEDQVIMWSLIAMFVFTSMGGAWFPLDITGKTFAAIGHLMPTAWAMDGFQNIILRGLGLESVLLPVGILLAYAVAFFALAVWRFRFE